MKFTKKLSFQVVCSFISLVSLSAVASAAIYKVGPPAQDPYYPNGPIPQTPGCVTFGDIGDESPMCDSCATPKAIEDYNQLMGTHIAIPQSCDTAAAAAALSTARGANPGIVSEIELDTNQSPQFLKTVGGKDEWKVRIAIRDCFAEYTVLTASGSCTVQAAPVQTFYGECS